MFQEQACSGTYQARSCRERLIRRSTLALCEFCSAKLHRHPEFLDDLTLRDVIAMLRSAPILRSGTAPWPALCVTGSLVKPTTLLPPRLKIKQDVYTLQTTHDTCLQRRRRGLLGGVGRGAEEVPNGGFSLALAVVGHAGNEFGGGRLVAIGVGEEAGVGFNGT